MPSLKHVRLAACRVFPAIMMVIALCGLAATPARAACGDPQGRPRIGLVLSGGGALGATHVGVLKVLERLQVPIDCIAGTSMGSIVGGLYAAGLSAAELERVLLEIDWNQVFTDRPPRRDRDLRRKLEDRNFLLPFRVGIGNDKPLFPRGIVLGQQLNLTLRRMSLDAVGIDDFDALPIPFRAVAADIETGEAVVLGKGDLALAMRASMAVSGVFPPVDLDGKLLVDGGLANNLPVDVARAMGAERLIVVDIPTILQPREELVSAVEIIAQSLSLLILKSSQEQLAKLGPNDILIRPDLGDMTSADFDLAAAAIGPGEDAAEAVTDRLRTLALPAPAYAALEASRPEPAGPPARIDFIRIENHSALSDDILRARLRIRPGDPLDIAALEEDIAAIYGLDHFETVTYRVVEENGETGLVIIAQEKTIGLDTVGIGLNLAYGLDGESDFTIGGQLRFAGLDDLGAEALLQAAVGRVNRLQAAYLQPLDAATRYYLSPGVSFEDRPVTFYNDDRVVQEVRVREATATLQASRQLGTWGGLSVGTTFGRGWIDTVTGPEATNEGGFGIGYYSADFLVDTIDDPNFPRIGELLTLSFQDRRPALGDATDARILNLTAATHHSWGRNTVRIGGYGGTILDDSGSGAGGDLQSLFQLGGLLRLSGLRRDQLAGRHVTLGQLVVYRNIGAYQELLGVPLYLGGSLELGNVWDERGDINLGDMIPAQSLVLGADTPLGPAYLAYGVADFDQQTVYLLIGQRF